MRKKKAEFILIPRITQEDLARARAAQPCRVSFQVWNRNPPKKKGELYGKKINTK